MPPGYVNAYSSSSQNSQNGDYLPDARQRGRVSIAHVLPPSRDIARRRARSGIPADTVFTSILAKSLLALSLHLVKEWIMSKPIDPGDVNARLGILAAIATAIVHRPWELLGSSSRIRIVPLITAAALFAAETFAFVAAANNLPVLRLVMLTQCSEFWVHGLQTMRKKGASASTARNANFVALGTLGICYLAEQYLNRRLSKTAINSGYLSIIAYLFLNASRTALSSSISSSTSTEPEATPRYSSLAIVTSVPLSVTYNLLFPSPAPQASLNTSTSSLNKAQLLPTLALLVVALYIVDPLFTSSAKARVPIIRAFKLSWVTAVLTSAFIGITAFERTLHVGDFVVGACAYFGITHILHSNPILLADLYGASSSSTSSSSASFQLSQKHTRQNASTPLESLEKQYRQVRATIKTILENPDSKKIYFFLCLNLAFMFVQMMYGIWTNSLGLISDSIHMFFDCLALGMGLLASVMATWPRNETFTYGYARVETLSGFANGIFLILISIFIVFEAIQRLIDPPVMNTNQLLVVSSLGLAVNLVGMFATGHHHHGHSHGGHGHDHSHDHGHDHGHSHGHSHNMHGVFLHVMADTLGSVGVIISTLLINRYGWTGFDPIASIFIAVLIFASVVPLVMDSGRLLVLDMGKHREKDVRSALAKLSSVEGLSSYASAKFWPKDPATVVGSIHIQLAPSPSHDHKPHSHSHANGHAHQINHYANAEKVVKRVEALLKGAIEGLVDLSIQVEPTEGSENCNCMVVI